MNQRTPKYRLVQEKLSGVRETKLMVVDRCNFMSQEMLTYSKMPPMWPHQQEGY